MASAVSGGSYNGAKDIESAVSGGNCNLAGALPGPICFSSFGASWVGGGFGNQGLGLASAVSGGASNRANADFSSVTPQGGPRNQG